MPANRWFVGATPPTTSSGVSTTRLVVPSRLASKSHLRTSSAAPRRYIIHDERMGFSTRNRPQNFEGVKTLKQAQAKLEAANLALTRTTPGSQGRQRARARLTKTHRKVVNTRRYLVHQASRALVDQCQVLVIEDLASPAWCGTDTWRGPSRTPRWESSLVNSSTRPADTGWKCE